MARLCNCNLSNFPQIVVTVEYKYCSVQLCQCIHSLLITYFNDESMKSSAYFFHFSLLSQYSWAYIRVVFFELCLPFPVLLDMRSASTCPLLWSSLTPSPRQPRWYSNLGPLSTSSILYHHQDTGFPEVGGNTTVFFLNVGTIGTTHGALNPTVIFPTFLPFVCFKKIFLNTCKTLILCCTLYSSL